MVVTLLRYCRLTNKYTLEDIGEHLEILAKEYHHIECGKRMPTAAELRILARLYHTSMNLLRTACLQVATSQGWEEFAWQMARDNNKMRIELESLKQRVQVKSKSQKK